MLQLKIYGLWNLWALYQAVTPVVVIVTTGAKSKVRWRGIKSNKFSVWVDGWVKHRTFMRDEARSWRNFRPASVTSSSCLTLRSKESRKSSTLIPASNLKVFPVHLLWKTWTLATNRCLKGMSANFTSNSRSWFNSSRVQINRMKVKTATTRLY